MNYSQKIDDEIQIRNMLNEGISSVKATRIYSVISNRLEVCMKDKDINAKANTQDNENQNKGHNAKKEALGPNIRRK